MNEVVNAKNVGCRVKSLSRSNDRDMYFRSWGFQTI